MTSTSASLSPEAGLAEAAVVAGHLAVVGRVDDHRVVQGVLLAEQVEDAADLAVDLRDHGAIAAAAIGQPEGRIRRADGRRLVGIAVEAHVLGRGLDGRVGRGEADVKQERLRAVTQLETLDRPAAHERRLLPLLAQGPLVAGEVGGAALRLLHEVVPVLVEADHVVEHAVLAEELAVGAADAGAEHPVARDLAEGVPAQRVHQGGVGVAGQVAVVGVDLHVRLAHGDGVVARGAKLADEARRARRKLVQIGEAACVHAVAAARDGLAGGTAQRARGVCRAEERARLRQAVEIGRVGDAVALPAREVPAVLVCDYEDHVGRRHGLLLSLADDYTSGGRLAQTLGAARARQCEARRTGGVRKRDSRPPARGSARAGGSPYV